MVITIDFDLKEYREYIDSKPRDRNEFEIMKCIFTWNYICKRAKCRVCLTKKSLHLKIYVKSDIMKEIPLRILACDDIIRLEVDIVRHFHKLDIFTDTLFEAKIAENGKYVSVERCLDFEAFFKTFISRL